MKSQARISNIELNLSPDELRAILKFLGHTSTNDRQKSGMTPEEIETLDGFYATIKPQIHPTE